MKWYALYIDGELRYVRQWYGTPTVRDFGIGEMVGATYVIKEQAEYTHFDTQCLIISKEL